MPVCVIHCFEDEPEPAHEPAAAEAYLNPEHSVTGYLEPRTMKPEQKADSATGQGGKS